METEPSFRRDGPSVVMEKSVATVCHRAELDAVAMEVSVATDDMMTEFQPERELGRWSCRTTSPRRTARRVELFHRDGLSPSRRTPSCKTGAVATEKVRRDGLLGGEGMPILL